MRVTLNLSHKYLLRAKVKFIGIGSASAYIGFCKINNAAVARAYITLNADFDTYNVICPDMSDVYYVTIGRFGVGSFNVEGNEIITRNNFS